MSKRITRHDMFLAIAEVMAQRGTCERAQVGAVIVRDKRVVSTGYNGSPAGLPHCKEAGCDNTKPCTITVHAEANAIVFAARHGIPLDGTILYCTHSPCLACSQLIINAGVSEVVYKYAYRISDGLELMEKAGINITAHRWYEVKPRYTD